MSKSHPTSTATPTDITIALAASENERNGSVKRLERDLGTCAGTLSDRRVILRGPHCMMPRRSLALQIERCNASVSLRHASQDGVRGRCNGPVLGSITPTATAC